jgi:hypothetical protein
MPGGSYLARFRVLVDGAASTLAGPPLGEDELASPEGDEPFNIIDLHDGSHGSEVLLSRIAGDGSLLPKHPGGEIRGTFGEALDG